MTDRSPEPLMADWAGIIMAHQRPRWKIKSGSDVYWDTRLGWIEVRWLDGGAGIGRDRILAIHSELFTITVPDEVPWHTGTLLGIAGETSFQIDRCGPSGHTYSDILVLSFQNQNAIKMPRDVVEDWASISDDELHKWLKWLDGERHLVGAAP